MFFSTPTCHWCPLVTQQWRTAGVLEQLLQFRLLGVQSFTPRLHCLLLSTTQRHVIHGRPSARESRRIRGVVAVIGRPARAHGSRVSSADCSGCWTRWCEVRAARRLSVSGQGCASSCQAGPPARPPPPPLPPSSTHVCHTRLFMLTWFRKFKHRSIPLCYATTPRLVVLIYIIHILGQ